MITSEVKTKIVYVSEPRGMNIWGEDMNEVKPFAIHAGNTKKKEVVQQNLSHSYE